MRTPELNKTVATLAAIAALGGLSFKAASAEAAPAAENIAAHVDKNKQPLPGPPGVKIIGGEAQTTAEAQQALKHIDGRWTGILVLGKSNTPTLVDLTASPSAYGEEDPALPDFTNKIDSDYTYLDQPYIISDFKGRTYAAEFNPNPGQYNWEFLDIAWARSNGALTSWAIKGVKPRTKPFHFGDDAAHTPLYDGLTSWAPENGHVVFTNLQGDSRTVYIQPTKVFPKTRTKR